MLITVKRSGGYTGQEDTSRFLDTSQMPRTEASAVEDLVKKSHFFEMEAGSTCGAIGADLFRFEIAIHDGKREHTVVFVDDGFSPEFETLRKLVQEVTKI
ncbi:MAG: hypothetical protein HY040_27765 [Planctomycetes bacterium]|nr:hypothetical protein [Planctomycetota bacterium]